MENEIMNNVEEAMVVQEEVTVGSFGNGTGKYVGIVAGVAVAGLALFTFGKKAYKRYKAKKNLAKVETIVLDEDDVVDIDPDEEN